MSSSSLEPFILLAKSAKGAAAAELIKQALDSPGVYVFGELLDMPNIVELNTSEHQAYFNLLNLYAYGTYQDYLRMKDVLPDLTAAQQQKLRHLTIITLAETKKDIPYECLVKELDMPNLRDVEDLVIEAMYADIIHGKLDQQNCCLEVEYAIGRDVKDGQTGQVIQTLSEWCEACEVILGAVETQVNRANSLKENHMRHKSSVEEEVQNIKKTLKTQGQEGDEMATLPEGREGSAEKGKKLAKGKGIRGSVQNKFWNKS